jgi:ribonuclease HI
VGCGSCGCNEIKEDREPGVTMRQAVEWVRDTTFDLWHLLHPDKGNRQKEAKHWRRPVIGWTKCNVDGAFQERDSTGATGIVLRNHAGEFIGGRASWQAHCPDVLAMEALACRDGLQLAQRLGVTKVCIKTNCLELTRLWEKLETQRSAIKLILLEIKQLCRSFDEFSQVFASRSCNRVAH